MSWFYLLIASILEFGWPVGLKYAQISSNKVLWILIAIILMSLSGYFLYLAQKEISIGTAYAIWTGIGMLGTFFIGMIFFHDAVNFLRFLGVFLILTGVVILRITA